MENTKPRKAVIAIDGPAGSGKSTAARKLAHRLGFVHLNSGALFRAVGLLAKDRSIALNDEGALSALARQTSFVFEPVCQNGSGPTRFLVNGGDLTERLLSDEAGSAASVIGLLPGLRDVLCDVQRQTAKHYPLVVEGRDAGSVVFPDAEVKFYLDASLDIRAQRRLGQLQGLGQIPAGEEAECLNKIKEEIARRDYRDQNREVAPGIRAEDAILVDTSGRDQDEVLEELVRVIDKLSICEKEG